LTNHDLSVIFRSACQPQFFLIVARLQSLGHALW
jgi:hypothetical protein